MIASDRLEECLKKQKKAFEKYLELLAGEEQILIQGDMEVLRQLVEREKGLINEIYACQKVIAPLENAAIPPSAPIAEEKAQIENLRIRVLGLNGRNRARLRAEMEKTAGELKNLRRNFRGKTAYGANRPTMIDIKG